MHVRMMRQRRTPGVQHQRGADLGTQVFRIGCDGRQRFGCHVEQQSVDCHLVGVGNGADRLWQREDDVVILDRQQVGLSGFKPTLRGTRLTLRAVPIAAGVVADLLMVAGIAAQCVSPQCRRTALFDGRHSLELTEAQVSGLLLAPCRTVGAEDVGDLQGRPPHGGATRSSASPTG